MTALPEPPPVAATVDPPHIVINAEPFVRVQTLLKKEKLFVAAEKNAIRDLYVSLNELTEKLLSTAWCTHRLNRNLDFLVNNKISVAEWDKKLLRLEVVNFTTAHSESSIANLAGEYERLLRYLKSHPDILAAVLEVAQKTDSELLMHTVMFSLFGNYLAPQDELRVLQIIKITLHSQLAKADHSAEGVRVCFRSNPLIIKLFSAYSNGKLYLSVVLYEPIMTVLADDTLNLEIEPLKVLAGLPEKQRESIEQDCRDATTGELDETKVASHFDLQKIINGIYEKLIIMCRVFIDSLVAKIATVPYGIRYLGKVIMQECKMVGLYDEVARAIVGDFVFSRLFNPAIVSPEPYGIITDTPVSKAARRSLTLIAKVLASLTRGPSVIAPQREAYLAPLQDLILRRNISLDAFLDAFVDVGEPEESLRYPPASVVNGGRRDTVSLTSKELELLHRSVVLSLKTLPEDCRSALAPILKRLPTVAETEPAPSPPISQSAMSLDSPSAAMKGRSYSVASTTTNQSSTTLSISSMLSLPKSKSVVVFAMDDGPDTRLLTEKEVLSVGTKSVAVAAESNSSTTNNNVDLILEDAKKKLRLVLCSMSFTTEWKDRTLTDLLESELFEAQTLSNREHVAHLQEMMRCLQRLPREYLVDDCLAIRQSMEQEYRERSRYIEYLVSLKQNLLTTHDVLRRQLQRIEHDKNICLNYVKVFKIRNFLEKRESDIVSFVERFSSFELLDEKAACAQRFFRLMCDSMRADPNFHKVSEVDLEEAYKVMEKHFMCRIYDNAFWPNGEMDTMNNVIFSKHILGVAEFITVNHESLQIQKMHQSEAPWPAAQKELLRMNAYKSAEDKLSCIVSCCKTIMDLIQMTGKSASADDFFPVLVYVIVHANPPNLPSTIQFIKYFYESRASGEASYWWAQFTIAVEFIKTISEKPQKVPNK